MRTIGYDGGRVRLLEDSYMTLPTTFWTHLFRISFLCSVVIFPGACSVQNDLNKTTYREKEESGSNSANSEGEAHDNSEGGHTDTPDNPSDDAISKPGMISGTFLTQCSVQRTNDQQIKCKIPGDDTTPTIIDVDFIFIIESEHGVEKIKLHAEYNSTDKSWITSLPDRLQEAEKPEVFSENEFKNPGIYQSEKLIQILDPDLITSDVSRVIDEENNYHKVMVLMIKNIEDALSNNDI